MSLSNKPTVQQIQKESDEGAKAIAAAASADSSSLNPYELLRERRIEQHAQKLAELEAKYPILPAPCTTKRKRKAKLVVSQPNRVLRPRGDGVDYRDDEDDPVRPQKRLKKGDDDYHYESDDGVEDDEMHDSEEEDDSGAAKKKNSKGKKSTKSKSAHSAPNTKKAASSKKKSPSTLSDTKKAALEQQQMVQVESGKKHASLLTKEQARVAVSSMTKVQLLAYAKANGVGSMCPKEYRAGLSTRKEQTRKNVTNYLTGLPYTEYMTDKSLRMKERMAEVPIGACAARMLANVELGGPALARFLKLDQNKHPLCIKKLDESTDVLAIMPSHKNGDCSSLALMNAAKMELTADFKKKVKDPKSSVDMNIAAATYLNKKLVSSWGLEQHPKTSSSRVPGWERTIRLYTLPTSVIGSGQTTVYGSWQNCQAIKKMVAMK